MTVLLIDHHPIYGYASIQNRDSIVLLFKNAENMCGMMRTIGAITAITTTTATRTTISYTDNGAMKTNALNAVEELKFYDYMYT
jgi:GTP cyclohydrolase I